MMGIGIMRVPMLKRCVTMPMHMRLVTVRRELVVMLMMLVMRVGVRVLERFVHMFVDVVLGQMQPQSYRHQEPRADQLQRHRFIQQRHRNDRTDKRRH